MALLALLPAAAWLLTNRLASWVLMWSLAIAIYAGLKWLTWWRGRRMVPGASQARSFAYLLLWPGMDAPRFLRAKLRVKRPSRGEWLRALLAVGSGAVLFWSLARIALRPAPLLAGWIGLVGMALMLHFGAFRLLSNGWRWLGVDADPLMQAPVLAGSLGEFWGKRWNTAFHVLARDLVVAPARRRFGGPAALMLAFLASGMVHDLVISVPARGGFGLPTAYFLLQGLGLLAERSSSGRRLGLGSGRRGHLYALAVSGLPAVALFHPPFVITVFLPFMHWAGAL